MKYLVHELGVDRFRQLVESYTGKKVQPWRDIPDWKYSDWLGWHEQGDGNWFLGVRGTDRTTNSVIDGVCLGGCGLRVGGRAEGGGGGFGGGVPMLL